MASWTPALDTALQAFAMETCFDWEETAVQLAAFSGHSAVFTGDEVRLRWAAIAGADEGGGDDLGDIDDDLMLDELIAAAEEGVDGSSVPQLTTGNASVATFELVEGYFGSAATEGSVPDYDDESVHKLDSDDEEEGGAPEESAAIRELDAAENALATIEAERRVAREQLFQRVLTSLGGPSDSDADVPIPAAIPGFGRHPVPTDAQVHVSVTVERMKTAKPPSATSQALRAQRLAELQREREAMLAMIAPQVTLDVTGIAVSDDEDSEDDGSNESTAAVGEGSELAEVLGILSQERRKRRAAGQPVAAVENPMPHPVLLPIVTGSDPRLALGAVESKLDESVVDSPLRSTKGTKPAPSVRFVEPPAAVDRKVISTLLHSESGRELRSELAQLRHAVAADEDAAPTPQLSYVVEAHTVSTDLGEGSDASRSEGSDDEDWSTLRQRQKRVASRAQSLLETVGVTLPTTRTSVSAPMHRVVVGGDESHDDSDSDGGSGDVGQLAAAAQQELDEEWAWQARVEAEHERRMTEVLAESEAAKQRREAEIEAIMATQPPIFVFNEELLRKVTEQSQEPVPASGPEPEAKVEVAVASEPQASAGKVEFVPPPPLPSRRERKIAQDSESDDSDVEVAVTSKALDHYRATTRTSRLPPLPPSPMKTAQDGLEGGAIESKSLYDDGDDDNTTPSAEAQKQRIAATVLSDKVPGTPLFEPSVSFLPAFPRVPPASAFDFSRCVIGRMASWSMLDSVAQCAFIGGLFASASQVPTCYHIVALELFSTPNTAPCVVVGFQLLPGSSITDLKAQLVACRVADTDLAQLIAVDETSAHTRSSFESMFPSITGCHVLPCQSRSGDVGAGRSSPDALTVAVVHNGLLQRSGSLTAVLNSLVDEGFELAGVQLVYPSIATCRAASGCFVPTLATAGLPVLALCIRGKSSNTAASWFKLHTTMTVRVGATPCIAVDDHNKPLLSSPSTPAAAYKELALWFSGHVDAITGALPDYEQRTYSIAPAIISRTVVVFDASVHYTAFMTALPKLAAAGLSLAGFGLVAPTTCFTQTDSVPLWVKGSSVVIATIWSGDNAVIAASHALSSPAHTSASLASPSKQLAKKLVCPSGTWVCENAARAEEIASMVTSQWCSYPPASTSYRSQGSAVSATKLDTYCDQTVVVVVPAFAFETLSSAHFNAIGKRVGTPTVPPVVPILSALLQHGPDSVLSALLEANPLKSRGLGTVEANISGGFAAIAAKTVARASEALKHVILSAVGKALVPEWSSHLQGPVVVLVLRRLDARRKVRSILGLDRDDGSKNALQDLLQSKYGLDLPSVAAVITSAVKVGDVLFKCFDVSELHQPQGFPASVDSLSLPGERLGYDWAIDGRRDSVAVTVVTASSPFAQRKVFPRLARAVEDSGLKLVWVKLDVLGDEIAHVVLRDESEVNRKQLFPLLTSQVSVVAVLSGPCALSRWLTLAGSSPLFDSSAASSQLSASACLCNILGGEAFVFTPQSQLDSLSLISKFTSQPPDSIWDWSEDQPSLGGCDVVTSALNNSGRKLVRCSGPLLHRMVPSTPSVGHITDIPIPPALKLKETTCLLLSPTLSRPFVDSLQSFGDEYKRALEDVLDVLLKDGFLLAGMKLVRLSSDEASAFVSHQRKHSRSHSLSDLDYSSLLVDAPVASSRVTEYDDEREVCDRVVCLVLAVYRDNAVAHLRRIVEDGKEAAAMSHSDGSSLSVFGRLAGHVFPSLSIAGAAQELAMFFASLCDGPDLIIA